MRSPPFLYARTHEPRDVAIRRLLDSVGEIGSVLETRSFSGVLLMMKLELSKSGLRELPDRLGSIRVPLERSSLDVIRDLEAMGDDEVEVVLDITFVDGNPDLVIEVPKVPG